LLDLNADEDLFEVDSDDDATAFEIDGGVTADVSTDDDEMTLDDAVELGPLQDDGDDIEFGKTEIITRSYEDTEVVPVAVGDDAGTTEDDPGEIDLGMEDTANVQSVSVDDDAAGDSDDSEFDLGMKDSDDAEDISIIDFGGDDFDEPTAVVEVVADDDVFVIDDDDAEESRTGTFAPGDFDEPTEAIASIADVDDIDDLMLPEDVDEVSTKLDLARAFIDMGDTEGARGSLEEVVSEGNAEQKAEAKALLDQI